ncbi:MAG TPA: hypothetical protein DCY42_01695 [Chloroflexi bacterium]|nr:hypothetical protein [Chloroflexota bacterium]
MRLWNSLLGLGILILASACTPQAPPITSTAAKTNAPPPTATQTPEPSEISFPTPAPPLTPTTAPEPILGPLYNWPIAPLSDAQIQDVLDCQNATWSGGTEIDPQTIGIEDLVTACDFGLKALSLIDDFDTLELSNLGLYYAQQALLLNPGILFANPYFFYAFNEVAIVESPLSMQPVVKEIKINYNWSGIGNPVNYSVTITNAETPLATGNVEVGPGLNEDESMITNWTFQQALSPELLEGLGSVMVNLIPVKRQGMMYACFDNYPNWEIEFAFDNGDLMSLLSNGSNFFLEGGPFQTRIEGQNYVMASYEFNLALNKIIQALALPYGQTLAMSCHPFPVAEGLFTDLPIPDYFP